METSPKLGRAVRFGTFELDLAAGELRKNGLKVRLQEQPFQLLVALVAKPGEVVTREHAGVDRAEGRSRSDGETAGLFERVTELQHGRLFEVIGDDLHSDRQPFAGLAARNAHACVARQAAGERVDVGEIHLERVEDLLA